VIKRICGSYWKAKNSVEVSRIVLIAKKYDTAIALIQYERDRGLIPFDYAEAVIEELRRNAEKEMAEKGRQ
jgi:predicted acylesterase/phospholipase RssA